MSSGCLIVYRWYLCPRPVFPTVVVYHWHTLLRPALWLTQQPVWAEGSGQPDWASFLVFLSPHLFQLSWHITMYGPHGHLLAIRSLLVDGWPRCWQNHGSNTAVVTQSQKPIKESNADTETRPLSNCHSSCLARPKKQWPAATQPDVSVAEELKETLWKVWWEAQNSVAPRLEGQRIKPPRDL